MRLAPDAIAEKQIEDDQRDEKSQDRFCEPAEDVPPTGAERASAAALALQANSEGGVAARREHAAVAADGISATRARPYRDGSARNAAGVRRAAAVAQEIGHGAL